MSGRQTREATLAVALVQRTGCTPAEAAKKFGVNVTTVRRALDRAGVPARAVGRPSA